MKTNCFITVLFCLTLFGGSFAQTWPMPGAQWEYCSGGAWGYSLNFAYTKDTIINSSNYQVIEHTNATSSFNQGAIYTRYSNDTVYRYVHSKEYPFLIFNAAIADVYTTFRTYLEAFADSTCSSILPIKVLQLDTVTFGTLSLRHWVLEDTLFNYIYTGVSYPASKWNIAERMGFMNNFPFTPTTITGYSCTIGTDAENGGYYLHSYSDSAYNYVAPWNCSTGIGKSDQLKENKFNLYPNPANGVLNISTTELSTSEIIIYDILGREVFKCNLFKVTTTLAIEKLPIGFYFLKRITTNNSSTKSFIINR